MASNFGYNPRKAGQVAAFFALSEGGTINVVKLVKLIYLADRAFMNAYDEPMLMDRLVSMRHGPVDSRTYDFVNEGGAGWDEFISGREGHTVGVSNDTLTNDDLDEVSEAELEVLTNIWNDFGHMDQWQLVDYTHKNCPEWEDPEGSSATIPYSRVFKFLGKKRPRELEQEIMGNHRLAIIFANAK